MRPAIIAALSLLCPVVFADTILVPADYATIQGAIVAAANGDKVLVAPGTYPENIDFLGKAIIVTSEQGLDQTVIDGLGERVANFSSGEGLDSVLDGFTLRNGGYFYGGCIYCDGASPRISNNLITQNNGGARGGGICCDAGSSPVIEKNIVSENWAFYGAGICCYNSSPTILENKICGNYTVANFLWNSHGGGIHCYNSSPWIAGNLIAENITNKDPGMYANGGGIYLENSSAPLIESNTFVQNSSADSGGGLFIDSHCHPEIKGNIFRQNDAGLFGGAVYCYYYTNVTITNNLIIKNSADSLSGGIFCSGGFAQKIRNNTIYGNSQCGVYCSSNTFPVITNTILWANSSEQILNYDGYPTVTYSNIQGGWTGTGNIDADPQFVDPFVNDFHLTYPSPCRDSGINAAVAALFDFEGDPRIAWDGTVDMGADEFYTHLYVTGDPTPGGDIQGKLVGLPGTTPVGLFIGSGVRETPLPTPYGNFYLLPPKILIPLIAIPAGGVLQLSSTIPLTPPAPYDLPMQGLVGLDPDSLTNLFVLEVR